MNDSSVGFWQKHWIYALFQEWYMYIYYWSHILFIEWYLLINVCRMKHWSNFLFNEWYFCWYVDWRSIEVTFYLRSDISWSIEVTFYLTSDISWSIEVTFIYWVIFLEAMKWLLFIKCYFLKHRNDIIYRVIFLEGWSIEVTLFIEWYFLKAEA
jgi:hypothetical protein